jgi:hypothetical protein
MIRLDTLLRRHFKSSPYETICFPRDCKPHQHPSTRSHAHPTILCQHLDSTRKRELILARPAPIPAATANHGHGLAVLSCHVAAAGITLAGDCRFAAWRAPGLLTSDLFARLACERQSMRNSVHDLSCET